MKVGQTNEALPVDRVSLTGTRPSGGSGSSPAVTSTVQASDTVELSKTSQQLSSSADVVDVSKVERIKAAIAEGKFPVNAQKVADSMIHEAASLLESIVLGKPKS
jgi:negative regulator of flagellin synthesis FlgM